MNLKFLARLRNSIFATLFVSASVHAVQIGAWVGGEGDYPQPTEENVTAFETLQNRKLDYLSVFALWDINDWAWTQTYADIAEAHGSKLLVTWMPNGYAAPSIVAGDADDYITTFAKDVKAYGKEIWLRPLHEANGNWYDWCVGKSGAGNTNANLVEAWRHIVTIFRNEGIDNVKWVWTTNATNEGSGTSYTGTYPGNEWVDYISIDGYNWGTAQTWSSWKSFKTVFSSSYKALAGIDKPLFIAEFSSSEHGGNKAQWINDMFASLATDFPRIFALMWFSQTKSYEADWAIDTSPESLAAWKAGIAEYGTTATLPPPAKRPHIVPQTMRYFDLLGRQ